MRIRVSACGYPTTSTILPRKLRESPGNDSGFIDAGMAPMAKQSKEFMNCVKNAETGIINLSGIEFTDVDGEGGFIERPVAVHYCSGGDVTKYLNLVGQ